MSNAFDKASLVMLPHAYEDGKLYSLKPTDRSGDFTFSRGSDTATRVGEDGYIKKETANLLLQSNQFDTTWATSTSASVVGNQIGYDGSNDAWLLSKTAANQYIQQQVTFGGINTFSVYIKAQTSTWVALMRGDGQKAFFDLSGNGALGNVNNGITSKIESVGSGWFRCSFTFENSSTNYARIYPADGNGDTSGTTGSIYIQDAQLNQGLVAQDYLETTTAPVYGGLTDNMPRLDYTDATCPSLLLEPSRTNLIPQSEYYGVSSWNKTRVTLTTNATTSPEGVINSSLIIPTTTNGDHLLRDDNTVNSIIAGQKYTLSAFAKQAGYKYYRLYTIASNTRTTFDLSTGTMVDNTGDDYSVTDMGDGWYRLTHTFTAAATYERFRTMVLNNNNSAVYVGDGTSGIYVYGHQFEQGSYPTSYIPTYGSSQTRAVDNLTSTPLSINGLFGETSGSIFMEFTNPLQGFSNNWFYMSGQPVGGSDTSMRVRGYWQMNIQGLTWNPTPNLGSLNNATKVAVKWGGGVAKLFIDGSEDAVSTYTGGDINMNGALQSLNGAFNFAKNNANFKQILFFNSALSDSELQALTTL